MIGTSPQFFCALATCVAAMLTGAPWIFELRDLWPDPSPPSAHAGVTCRWRSRAHRAVHDRHASAVVAVSRSFIENLTRRGIDPSKLAFVPNGVDMGFWARASRSRGQASLGLDENTLLVSYIGTVGWRTTSTRSSMPPVCSATTASRSAGSSSAMAPSSAGCGIGRPPTASSHARSLAWCRASNSGLPRRQRYLARDVETIRRLQSVLPSKMFESMAAGRPIVLAVEGEARATLERSGGGLAVPPGDPALRRRDPPAGVERR